MESVESVEAVVDRPVPRGVDAPCARGVDELSMRPFVVIAVLVITAGAYFLVAGAVRAFGCVESGVFACDVWSAEFWLLVPGEAAAGLGPNAGWLLRVAGGGAMVLVGRIVLRVARG